MSLTPAIFDHPTPSQVQGFAISAGGLGLIGLALFAGIETIGWRDTSAHAWRIAALLFLVPFVSDALIRFFRGEAIDRLAEWAPRIELFFIAAYAGSWIVACYPALIAGERIASLTLAGSVAGFILLALMLVTSPKFFAGAGRIRTRIYNFASAGLWAILFLSFLDRYVGPHAPDLFLPTILILMIGAVLLRFAASFQQRHPAFFD